MWHNPLTIDDLLSGMAGRPFSAMCGKRCNPRQGELRHASSVTGIERCAVCADLVASGQRIQVS